MKEKQYYIDILEKEKIIDNSIYPYLQLKEYQKGDCLLNQGQTLDYLYILVEGCLKTCHTTANGTTSLNAFSYPIMVIGEIELLQDCDALNSIHATEKTVCFQISLRQHKERLFNDLVFMQYLAKTIASKLYNANTNTSISMNYPVENRLASFLIVSQEDRIVKQNFVQVAEMIGCSYRQLQRVLNSFCENGYIKKIKRGQFEIINSLPLETLGKDLYVLK